MSVFLCLCEYIGLVEFIFFMSGGITEKWFSLFVVFP